MKDILGGLGLETISLVLQDGVIVWYAFLLKALFTFVTLNFGGSGGLINPMLFNGATLGSAFADLFGIDRATFAVIGMVAVLAGAASTPIAASIMSVELFGPELGSYAAVACAIRFIVTGHRSAFPSQIRAEMESRSQAVEKGKECRESKADRRQPKKHRRKAGREPAEVT